MKWAAGWLLLSVSVYTRQHSHDSGLSRRNQAGMEGRPLRRLVLTVRAAADLGETPSNPYVAVQLGDQEIETDVAMAGGENPVSRRRSAPVPPPAARLRALKLAGCARRKQLLLVGCLQRVAHAAPSKQAQSNRCFASLTAAQVWDEPIELRLPPPLPDEQPLQVGEGGRPAAVLMLGQALGQEILRLALQRMLHQCALGLERVAWPETQRALVSDLPCPAPCAPATPSHTHRCA